jgi:hypothetical protein
MDSFIWIFTAVLAVLCLVLFCLSFVPCFQEWTAERLARSVALILTPEVHSMVCTRIVRRMRGSILGCLAGMLVGLAILNNDPPLAQLPLSPLLWTGVALAGTTVGAAITAVISGTRLPNDEIRFARAEATGLDDYVAPIERFGARIAVALVAAALLVSLTLGATGLVNFATPLSLTGGGILGVLAIAALTLFELYGRWIVRRGQPAGSTTQLSWDDALRSALLRDLAVAPIALGGYGLILALTELASALAAAGADPTSMLIAANLCFTLATITIVLIAIYIVVSKPQRYFRLRLWADLAEGL